MFQNGLFIFHRDFRIYDNIGLIEAVSQCNRVYCCFIFTPEQASSQNEYKSNNAVQFMIESLEDLSKSIQDKGGRLITCYGNYKKIVNELIHLLSIEAVYCNQDYTPYAIRRQHSLERLCAANNIHCGLCPGDYYLYEPGTVVTKQLTGFKKYTPFYNEVVNRNVRLPSSRRSFSFAKSSRLDDSRFHISLREAMTRFVPRENPNILVHGGRRNGLIRLRNALETQSEYVEKRDILTYNTTFLSAYIKFGCVSIREVYHSFAKAFGKKSGIIRELIWREFFAHVLFHYPEVLGRSYQPRFRELAWRRSESDFEAWKTGNTGFPVVDAGMRQMNQTGYMHNRVRMIVASFLIKVLLMDWRMGEKYFAQQLTDYDIASNNGNWQGISGTGVDMKPYFRDMNPWLQSVKFDKNAEYIKTWVPELRDVSPLAIHTWNDSYHMYNVGYPKPMIDYYEQKEKMMDMYSNA